MTLAGALIVPGIAHSPAARAQQNPIQGADRQAVAWTGNSAVTTAVDNYGNLLYWYRPSGGSWIPETVAAPASGGSFYAPSITWAPSGWPGGAALITATDSAANLDFWYQLDGAVPWTKETIAS